MPSTQGSVNTVKLSKNQRKRLKKKTLRNQKNEDAVELKELETTSENDEEKSIENPIEIEYISADLSNEISEEDPLYKEFATVFEKFTKAEDLCRPSDANEIEGTNESIPKEYNNKEENEDEEEEESKVLSRKLRKKNKRLSVAELKQLVSRPDVVEAHDVTASDPRLLVFLKAYRNTVPVPRHWCHKRKYLQGKRGVEKQAFRLPDFIAQTGIENVRGASTEEEEKKKSKQKARERVQPKMGRVDIDYQVLHDAFFRHQTKPKLSIHGDLYYEGKEFEVKLKAKAPGNLSDELKNSLGMSDGVPPPWLLHMQRYGPPPSYPSLKIPGLNAPIPEGSSFGYHPGGWGKPPVDEFGRPLYGDVFAIQEKLPFEEGEPISKEKWGEVILEPQEEEEDEEEEEEEETKEDDDQSGLETPLGDGISSVTSGMETPGVIDLRKSNRGMETPETPHELYTVLPQQQAHVGGALYGSSHTYALPGQAKKRGPGGVAVSLDASELADMDDDVLKRKYENALQAKNANKEDLSDILEEARKRKRKSSTKSSDTKKYKDYKF